MKTKNTFIFSWDQLGIESIVPIHDYEQIDKDNVIRILKGNAPTTNPVNSIIRNILMRAKLNPQRHYEIYAVDCDLALDEEFWKMQWKEHPQFTAELIRDKGHKLFSDRTDRAKIVIE